ncbi:MAG: hypothetical protein II180_10145 [Proteobacteria bacterium]|nr:hypothetical protein [Pseudomonadota bacterium]
MRAKKCISWLIGAISSLFATGCSPSGNNDVTTIYGPPDMLEYRARHGSLEGYQPSTKTQNGDLEEAKNTGDDGNSGDVVDKPVAPKTDLPADCMDEEAAMMQDLAACQPEPVGAIYGPPEMIEEQSRRREEAMKACMEAQRQQRLQRCGNRESAEK